MTRTTAFRFAVAVLAGFSLLGVSCGADKQSADTVGVASTEESHPIVDDATVTAGLTKTGEILKAAATTPDTAEADWDKAHTTWATYEGTIKQNRPDSYLAMEDALAASETAAKAGDSAALIKAAADFQSAAATYLAAFPG
ncbi:MAG: hypothetical protein ABI706_13185 [Ilumatobacteraceae bacterium]